MLSLKKFNAILKSLRINKHMTQQELAKHLGISRATVAGYETKGKQPDYDKLIALSKLFNVSVDYLIGNTSKSSNHHSKIALDTKFDNFIQEIQTAEEIIFNGKKLNDNTKLLVLKAVEHTKEMTNIASNFHKMK